MSAPDDDPLMTSEELAALMRVGVSTLSTRRHDGRPMPVGVRVGRRVLYRRSAVEAFLAELPEVGGPGRLAHPVAGQMELPGMGGAA